jgi:threonine dehydratase
MSRLKFASILEAARVIDPVFLHTPQYVSESLSVLLGARMVVKVETANPVRCFKGRGAEYFVSRLEAGGQLITASAGNLGQAMAYACRKRGVRLTVYASVHANPYKLDRIRAFGAEVVLFGRDFDEAKAEARRAAAVQGIRMVEDSLDVETGEGAGTIGLELAAFPERLDAVLLALGNGALACGTGCYLKHASPNTRIVAVQSEGAPAMIESWQQRRLIRYDSIKTIADGIGVRVPIAECIEDMRDTIDEAFLVKDETIIEAMRLAHQHLGLVLEPSGAATLAAVMENRARFAGQTVAVVLCGGNLTPEQMRTWLG